VSAIPASNKTPINLYLGAMNTELAENVFWVGSDTQMDGLRCNPYLLIAGDEAVLFDPGSPIDFDDVLENVLELIPLHKISYVVLSHQDPDLCASVPLFEQKGLNASLVCHWRSSVIIQYYNVTSPFYLVDQHDFQLVLENGRKLQLIHAPYLHFPGSILTFDPVSKILFSGDLFGGFSQHSGLFADEHYDEAMQSFHESYMPSNDILRPIMEFLLNMDISTIAPQHGSIINGDVRRYVKSLRDLECGTFLTPIRKKIANIGGYVGLCNKILKRYRSLFGAQEVEGIFAGTDIILDTETITISDFADTGKELWNHLFELVFSQKGMSWIAVVSSLVEKLSKQYDIALPQILQSTIFDIEREIAALSDENRNLKLLNERLESNLKDTRERLIKCPITNLYNAEFFHQYLETEAKSRFEKNEEFAILRIDLDNLARVNFDYGSAEGNKTLATVARIIKSVKPETHLLFKLKGSEFVYYIPEMTEGGAVEIAETIRLQVEKSDTFITQMTVTIGLITASELLAEGLSYSEFLQRIMQISRLRLSIGKNRGMNLVCHTSRVDTYTEEVGKILVVDTDEMNLDVLSTVLSQYRYEVLICRDGLSALDTIEKQNPDLVISELMIPKLDGFTLREKMRSSSEIKRKPFILLSYQKDEASVNRAFEHDIHYFLKKPFMMSELLGIIRACFDADNL
jgi:two-component system, cell cycle response regulator